MGVNESFTNLASFGVCAVKLPVLNQYDPKNRHGIEVLDDRRLRPACWLGRGTYVKIKSLGGVKM